MEYIEKTEKKDKKNTLLVLLVSITFLASMIGATFAYYTLTIKGNETASSIVIKTNMMAVSYDSGNEIFGSDIDPNWSATKTFTVTNDGDSDVTYKIIWTNVNNNFANPSELKYSVTGSVTSGSGSASSLPLTTAPTTSGDMITNITIKPKAVHSYTFTISFPDTGSNQDVNQGKTFAGKIEIAS